MKYWLSLLFALLLVACDHDRPLVQDPWSTTNVDSLAFRNSRHYWKNYNFYTTDSLRLSSSLPGEVGSIFLRDTAYVEASQAIVVVNLASVPSDSIDSMWVLVASDVEHIGWLPERELTARAVPDNFISRFVHSFSLGRTQVVLAFVALGLLFFFVQSWRRARFQMVHFNDIKSFYPTFLCIIVSGSAVLYGALQQFAPEVWEEFYYHPTLNVFASMPFVLRLFVLSLWAMLVVGIAVVDDLRKQPGVVNALSYLASLSGVCMLLYLFFTQSVHIYVGYPLLVAYWGFGLRRHFYHNSARYRCGHCGNAMRTVGKCPYCGALNS